MLNFQEEQSYKDLKLAKEFCFISLKKLMENEIKKVLKNNHIILEILDIFQKKLSKIKKNIIKNYYF